MHPTARVATTPDQPRPTDQGWLPVRAFGAARLRWHGQSELFRGVVAYLALAIALGAWLVPIALGRLIDGDEGYLLMAARLVSEGRWPYRDFFLPQTPLVPALFGALFWATGRSWLGARLLAGLVAVATGLLVFHEVLSTTRRRSAALFATTLFVLSDGAIGWLTIVKGFGLAALWMTAAIVFVGSAVRSAKNHETGRRATAAAMAAGLLIGLAASTRLYAIAVVPTLAAYLVRELGVGRRSLRRVGAFALGCLAGLLPLFVCYAAARESFVFDTILYHGIREYGQDSLFGTAHEKLPIVLKTMGFASEATFGERQWMSLAILAVLARLLRPCGPRTYSAAAWVWPILLAASVLPNPFLPQYLCLPLPFLAAEAGRLLDSLLNLSLRQRVRRWPAALAAVAVVYLGYNAWVAHYERNRYLFSGIGVPGIESSQRVARWQIPTVEAVAREIDAQHLPLAASWWPGYLVSARTPIVTELANDFGFRAASVLSTEERRRIHVVSHAEVGEMIRRRQPRLFVEGNWATYPWASRLPENGYRIRRTIENVRLWTAE